MILSLNRKVFRETYTTGELLIDGKFFCYTLEDKDRGLSQRLSIQAIKAAKVYGQTAIPTGTYSIEKIWWEKHKRFVPHLINVAGFEGILIHSGVTSNDTLGCILVGNSIFQNALQNSTDARVKLDSLIFAELDKGGSVVITITS